MDFERYLSLYDTFDKGHDRRHVDAVVEHANALARKHLPDKLHLAHAAAVLHDIGLVGGREGHESRGAEMVATDPYLNDVFNKRELKQLVHAVKQHRASTGRPRSVLGKLVSDADRVGTTNHLYRAVQYREKNMPEMGPEDRLREAAAHIIDKYGPGGYGRRTYFPETDERLDSLLAPIMKAYNAQDWGELDLLSKSAGVMKDLLIDVEERVREKLAKYYK